VEIDVQWAATRIETWSAVPRIFVNYRTGHGEFAAALLDIHLAEVFGADDVFLASRTIEPGRDFADEIFTKLAECTVLLVVVGPGWPDAKDDTGRLKLDLPEDWVRREIAAAFDQGITVIPVLLDDMPRLDSCQLPTALAELGRCQAVRLRHTQAGEDLRVIVAALRAADDQMLPVLEADLRTYLDALAGAMTTTQSWMPYSSMDSAYLDRAVMVHGEAPPGPPDGGLYQDGSPLRHAEVPWAQAIRQVPIGVVLGDAGLGKTWLLRRHCLELCRAAAGQLAAGVAVDAVAVPLFLHAGRLAGPRPDGRGPRDVVAEAALSGLTVDFKDRARLLAFLAGRLAADREPVHLLVDALDEVFADEARDEVLAVLGWAGGLVRPDRGPRLLLSSRLAGFTDPFGRLGEDAAGDEDGLTPRYFQLGVLAEHQVRDLWARWFDTRGMAVPSARLDPVIAPGSAVKLAVRTPLVAAFAAWVAESEPVTPNRSGLYVQVVDRFLGLHWKSDSPGVFRALRGDSAARGRYRRAFVELAWRMAVGGPTWCDALPVDECEQVLDTVFGAAAGERSRTFDALRAFGVLVPLGGFADPAAAVSAEATVAWVHRSVHEFLVAERLVGQPAEDVVALVEDRCWFRPEWANVLDFAVGLEAGTAGRTVTDAVRAAALDERDGLGWFATVLTSAAAGMPPELGGRSAVVERVRRLHRAGLLTPRHLVQVLAMTPEARPDEMVHLVLTSGDPHAGGPETWTALAWCGAPGLAALRSTVAHSPAAAGAAAALRDVAPSDAVSAMAERLRAGLPVHPEDAAVLRELSADSVERLRVAYRRGPGSAPLARCVGWTCTPAGRADLMANLRSVDTAVRRAAVAGLVAGFGAELDTVGCETLLGVALGDKEPEIRLEVRDTLLRIAVDVPWVRRLLDERHPELYRDLPGRVEDLESLVARLVEPGPGTDLALMMIREEPELLHGDVRTAMASITAQAMEGTLTDLQIEHVAVIVGKDFVELARGRLDGSVRLPQDRLRRLVTGLLRAEPASARVFELIADCVGWNPDPALGVALRLHELDRVAKVEHLLGRLLRVEDAQRPSVQVWTDVLWATMLELPTLVRGGYRAGCAELTRHLLDRLD